jgi:hypothetical protein
MATEIRLYEAPDLVERKKVTGWEDRSVRFWGDDEHIARYSSATHKRCACGGVVQINWIKCASCRTRDEIAKYDALPRAEWDGRAMLYSMTADRYFESPDDAEAWLDLGQTLSDLRLVICEPQNLREVDEDYWHDELPEDGELPDAIAVALEALNAAIRANTQFTWYPGKKALALPNLTRGPSMTTDTEQGE